MRFLEVIKAAPGQVLLGVFYKLRHMRRSKEERLILCSFRFSVQKKLWLCGGITAFLEEVMRNWRGKYKQVTEQQKMAADQNKAELICLYFLPLLKQLC